MTDHPEIPGVHIDRTPPTPTELRAYARQALQLSTMAQTRSSQTALLSVAEEFMGRAALLDAPVIVVAAADDPTLKREG